MRHWIAPLALCSAAFAEQAQEQRAPEAAKAPKPRPAIVIDAAVILMGGISITGPMMPNVIPLCSRFPGNPVLVSDPVHGYRVVVPPPETRVPAPPETRQEKN